MDKSNNVIPALYALDTDVGGMCGDSYDIIVSGITRAFAVNSGRMAGKQALQYMGQ